MENRDGIKRLRAGSITSSVALLIKQSIKTVFDSGGTFAPVIPACTAPWEGSPYALGQGYRKAFPPSADWNAFLYPRPRAQGEPSLGEVLAGVAGWLEWRGRGEASEAGPWLE